MLAKHEHTIIIVIIIMNVLPATPSMYLRLCLFYQLDHQQLALNTHYRSIAHKNNTFRPALCTVVSSTTTRHALTLWREQAASAPCTLWRSGG